MQRLGGSSHLPHPAFMSGDHSMSAEYMASSEDQIVHVYLPETRPRVITLRQPVALSEAEIVHKVAERFVVHPHAIALGTTAYLRDLHHDRGQLMYLPFKIKLPDFRSAEDLAEVGIQWSGRPQSRIRAAVPAEVTAHELSAKLESVNALLHDSVSLQVNGVPIPPQTTMHGLGGELLDAVADVARAGARNNRRPRAQDNEALDRHQKKQMQTWAIQRIRSAVQIEDCVIRNIVKSEMRTASASLHARSQQQVRHVVKAALLRQGYPHLAQAVQEQMDHARPEDAEEQGSESHSEEEAGARPSADAAPNMLHENHPRQQGHQDEASMSSAHQQQQPAPDQIQAMQYMREMRFQYENLQQTIARLGGMIITQQAAITMLSQQMATLQHAHVENLNKVGVSVDLLTARQQELALSVAQCMYEHHGGVRSEEHLPAHHDSPRDSQPAQALTSLHRQQPTEPYHTPRRQGSPIPTEVAGTPAPVAVDSPDTHQVPDPSTPLGRIQEASERSRARREEGQTALRPFRS